MDDRIYREVWVLLDQLHPPKAPLASWEKAPSEWVTEVDVAIEATLSPELEAILPGSRVVAEESSATGPPLPTDGAGPIWFVDPIDGTANFVSQNGAYATMVALFANGGVAGAWTIEWRTGDRLGYWAGLGVSLNGIAIERPAVARTGRGVLSKRYLPQATGDRLDREIAKNFQVARNAGCAATDYRSLLIGEVDFLLYERTLPWDHAPGVAMVKSLGGFALFGDGTAWIPEARPGLAVSFNLSVAQNLLGARARAIAAS